MQKFMYAYDIPFEKDVKVYGAFEMLDGVDVSEAFKQCLECKVLKGLDEDKSTIEDYYSRGLRLLFLVKVIDEEKSSFEAVYPRNPNNRLCDVIAEIGVKLFDKDMKGTDNND